jgi:hypothetical protein
MLVTLPVFLDMRLKFLKKLYGSLPVIRELRSTNLLLQDISNALEAIGAVEMTRFHDLELNAHSRYGSPKRLTRYEAKINSQNGEDGILQEIFKRIGVTNRFFIEIGVADGFECNTAFLLSQGWKGAWIDGSAAFQGLINSKPELRGRLKGLQSFVTRENICELLKKVETPADLDLLSLDIDRNTYYAWEGLKDFHPRVICIEYNSVVPPDREWKLEYGSDLTWDGTNNYGASLKSMELLGASRGYALVGCDFNGVNAFFVRSDLIADKFEGPFTAENHYEPPRFALARLRRAHRPTILDSVGN